MKKTNVARLLDRQKIKYELIEYQVDENDLGAETVAAKLNQNVEQVFKTLVLSGVKTGYFICVVPGNTEVNLKKAAKASGNKSAEMIPMKNLLDITGYIRGGCSPIGMKKNYPIFIHETCLNFENIYISAGKRGIQVNLNPNDLIQFTRATVCDLVD